MRRPPLPLAVLTLALLILVSCTSDEDAATTQPAPEEPAAEEPEPEREEDEGPEVVMTDAEGNVVGAVRLEPREGEVRIDARLEGLPPGWHGFHVHDVGLCEADAPDGPFTTATGHYVGEGGTHGDHDGDMPSLYVKEDGTARLTVDLDTFTVEELTEGDGAAVMVHAGSDNFANIPDRYTSAESGQPGPDEMTTSTGDAGARIACGVVPVATPGA
jgi:Cu-Zn family superoxide dismutase